MKRLLMIGCGFLAVALCVNAPAQTNISLRADTVLKSACDFLAHTRDFSLTAEVWREHVDDSGQKIQFSRSVDMDVKRPDGLRLEISSPLAARGFWYNGKTLTILDRKHNWYSTSEMPSSLDKLADTAHDKGIDLPLVDFALSDPYKNAMSKVQTGRYFGVSPVLGINCHHLAFTQDNVNWQIWIQDGPQPLIRKFVITYKNEPGEPEFTALITHWNLTDRIADSDFIFEKPHGATEIQSRIDTDSAPTK